MKRFVIYRTCDRPKYTELTFPQLIQATSLDAHILMVENSETEENWLANLETFNRYKDDRCTIQIHKKRLGITQPLIAGIEYCLKNYGEPEHIMTVDDDILVPDPANEGEQWDVVLSTMLDEGPWGAVGLYYLEPEGEKKGKGLAVGVQHPFMAGMCSGFRYSLYKQTPLTDKGIASYNRWTKSMTKCAWFAAYPFYIQEIDKRTPELSLRESDYESYTKYIDKMRYPRKYK